MPTEPSTIGDSVSRYAKMGYQGEFVMRGPGVLECRSCGASSPARDVLLLDLTRAEVSSDPDDQAVVAVLECPRCHARGSHAFSYGSGGSPEEAETFGLLRDARKRAR